MNQHDAFSLEKRYVLVTGAAGDGVGSGVCEAIHRAGGKLILIDVDMDRLALAANRYPQSLCLAADISKEEDVIRIHQEIKSKIGFYDGLVNNAGIGLSKPSHLIENQEFQRLIDIDLKGLWMMSKYFVQQCIDYQRKGSVVNISSVHAMATIEKYALYSSVKSAVQALTKGMAIDHGSREIRFNAISPGYVDSEQNTHLLKTFTPNPEAWIHRMIHCNQAIENKIYPIDCGHSVVFFLSDAGRSITGQILYVDAGTTLLLFDKNHGEIG